MAATHWSIANPTRRIFGPWRGLWHFPNVLQRRTASQSRFLSLLGWLESPGIRKHDSDDSKPRSCPLIKILPRSILSWTPNGRPRKAAKKFAALVVILFPYNVTKDGNALMYIYIYIIYIFVQYWPFPWCESVVSQGYSCKGLQGGFGYRLPGCIQPEARLIECILNQAVLFCMDKMCL